MPIKGYAWLDISKILSLMYGLNTNILWSIPALSNKIRASLKANATTPLEWFL